VLFKLAAIAGAQRTEFVALTSEAKLLFGLPWPGFDARRFTIRTKAGTSQGRLVDGGLRLLAGTLVLMVAASNLDEWGDAAAWLGVTGILLIVHLGYADLLTWALRDRGYAVRPLFDRPWASRSLAEFWTRRWNVAFVEMDRVLFLPILRRRLPPRAAAFGVFLISGVLHELAISYPAGSGFGRPLAYFGIHAIAVYAERNVLRILDRPIWLARIWTWLVVLIPLPLLFHEAFRTNLIAPLLETIGEVLP
jgi:alginate O-acetyltransferase complex protein AlgI